MSDETPKETTSAAPDSQSLAPVVDALDYLLEIELKRDDRDPSRRSWSSGKDERIGELRSRLRSVLTT